MTQQGDAVPVDGAAAAAYLSGQREAAPIGGAGGLNDRGRTRSSSGWTTRRWLAVGMCVAVVVLAVLSAVAAASLQHTSNTTDQLVSRTAPALTAAVQFEAAMVNQETGTRGYGLTGQSDFLQPYTDGLPQEQQALARLRTLTAGNAQQSADLTVLEARAAAWQQRIATPIAATAPGRPSAIAAERADEGKTLFDALRAEMAAEQADLQQAVAAGSADIARERTERDEVFIAIGATILLLFLFVFEGLRRGVAAPLTSLSSDTRKVTSGQFAHPVAPTGPADVRALAEDVEAMRRQLVLELAAADRARAALDAQAQELRRSNQELEQFAYVASHDLQEPLRKVASFCQLLQRRYGGRLDARADQYIGYAVDGAERMQKLITDLLAFSRVGRVHQDHAPVDLEDRLAEVLDNLEVARAEAGASIEHDALPTVNGDATQLTLLLQNLLSNAIKFRAPDRAPRIRLTVERQAELWRFAVCDNGIGIAPEYAERVFLIFQRLHTKDAYPGSGIGLAMCRKIVEFHGGAIQIDPDYRDGTRITFTLSATDRLETEAQ